jgi:hypothetical protein
MSGYKKYMTCPMSFKLHYHDKIRPIDTTSALIVGSIIDDILNDTLETNTVDLSNMYKKMTEYSLRTDIIWDKKDYDPLLLSNEDKSVLLKDCNSVGYPGTDVDSLMSDLFKIAGRNGIHYSKLSKKQKTCISICSSYSMTKKIELMVDAYVKTIIPKIKNPRRIQNEVTDGKHVRGYIDFIADIDGVEILLDNKTTKNKYTQYQIDSSIQLKLYSNLTSIYKVGYIVINKEIKHLMNGPKVDIQIMIFDVDPGECKDVYNEVKSVDIIANEKMITPKNLTSCHKIFGKPCVYLEYCKNKNMEGLKND